MRTLIGYTDRASNLFQVIATLDNSVIDLPQATVALIVDRIVYELGIFLDREITIMHERS